MKSRSLGPGRLGLVLGAGLMALLLIVGLQVAYAAPLRVDFKQCANEDPTLGDCHWIGGIIQKNNSLYYEGMSVPQRAVFNNVPEGTVHTLTFWHDASKGGIHAYDFLTSYAQAEAAAHDAGVDFNDLDGDACGPEIHGSVAGICSSLRAGANWVDVDVPNDPFISKDGSTQARIDAYESVYGNRTIRIYADQPITGAVLTLNHDVPDGGDTTQSAIEYTLTYTSTGTQLLVEIAGHISVSGDPSVNGIAWGVGLGASNISGGPYHFKLNQLDGASLGQQDNQIMGADILVLPGNIIVDKVTDPAGDPTSFDFELRDGAGGLIATFPLTDTQPPFNSGQLSAGTYYVEELGPPTGWVLDNIICVDPTGGTTTSGSTATIALAEGEDVTCTFYDSILPGTIIVEKQTDPDGDPTSFTFTGDAAGSISDGQQIVVSGLLPGTYSSQETVPGGWDLTSIVCDDDNSSGNVGTATATFNLEAGETVTCTFNDSIQRGTIIVEKQTDPDGDATSFAFTGDAAGSISDGQQIVLSDLLPGTYTSQETVPGGWDLTSIICDDANSSGNVGTATATFNLEADETVKCVFTDTLHRGTIIVEKQTDPDGDPTSFAFTGDAAGSISDGQQIVVSNLLPGTYSSQETVPGGWDLTSIICDDANSSGNAGTATATFNLEADETVKCVFTDALQRGTIIVEKQTDPDGDPTSFAFTGDAAGSISDGQQIVVSDLLPGTYSSQETVPGGWDLTSIICDDANSSGNVGTATATINLEPGETVTCAFTNTATPACIEIVKSGDSCAHPGEEISYGFWVHNCGDLDLEDVTVTDPLFGSAWEYVVGDLAADDGAAGGPDEASFNKPYTVPSRASEGPMPNTATVEGTDLLGRAATDQDGHVVDILRPCIDVTKTHLASKRAGGQFYPGDKVTYVFKVTNCSADTPLKSVTVVDEWVTPYSGQRFSKNLGSLGAGRNKGFSWVYTIPKDAEAGLDLVNKVTAFGVDDCGGTVDDTARDPLPVGQPRDGFVPEWESILLLASGLGPLAAYARMRLRKRR